MWDIFQTEVLIKSPSTIVCADAKDGIASVPIKEKNIAEIIRFFIDLLGLIIP